MSDCVTIFTDSDYAGGSKQLAPGRYNIDFQTVTDNTISSILIPFGWHVVAYSERDLQGERRSFSNSVAHLGDFNDKISSISVSSTSTGPVGDGDIVSIVLDLVNGL